MHSWIFLYIFMLSMISFLMYNNFLFMLLSIELIMMSIFFFFVNLNIKMNFSFDMIFMFVSMIIIESVFGLSLLISFSHSFGNDYYMF